MAEDAPCSMHSQRQPLLEAEDDVPRISISRKSSITPSQKVILLLTCLSLLLLASLPIIPGATSFEYLQDLSAGSDNQVPDVEEVQLPGHQAIPPTVEDGHSGAEDWEVPPVDPYLLSQDWDFNAPPQRREYYFRIHDAELNADGVFRRMMLINDAFPGPLIEVNEGDTLVVHVDNQASNATSIHWHGMYQRGSPWMDGTVGISNCPIAPGRNFTFQFDIFNQSGSYFYHAHHGVQAIDGLYGPLIVHSKSEMDAQTLQYASDRIVMIADHYYNTSNELLMDYLAPDAENAEPVPAIALINGMAVRDCDTVPDRKCINQTSNVQQPRLHLESGKLHRLRLIHTGAFAEMQVSIDDHEFAVTEVDGVATLPAYFDRINIQPAQRYSIVVAADHLELDAFWMRVKMLSTCFTDPGPELESETKAAIAYTKSNRVAQLDQTPISKDWATVVDLECRDMNTSQLVPAEAIEAPHTADATFYLRSNFEIGAYRLSRGFFNSTSWRANVKSPSLHRVIDGLQAGNASSFTSQSSAVAFVNAKAFDVDRELVIQSSKDQIIDLIISNFDDGSHPMHLHGHKYWVLAQGHGYPPEDLISTLNYTNPLRRDTATVEAFGWLLVRFIADNPGAWALHCHVSWHAEAGLMMQLVTKSDELARMAIPEENLRLCEAPITELEKGMAPRDEDFYFD